MTDRELLDEVEKDADSGMELIAQQYSGYAYAIAREKLTYKKRPPKAVSFFVLQYKAYQPRAALVYHSLNCFTKLSARVIGQSVHFGDKAFVYKLVQALAEYV